MCDGCKQRGRKLYAYVSSEENGTGVLVPNDGTSIGETVRDLLEASDGRDTVTVKGKWYTDDEYEALGDFAGW